jgi:hypothetical protein
MNAFFACFALLCFFFFLLVGGNFNAAREDRIGSGLTDDHRRVTRLQWDRAMEMGFA